MSGKREMRNKEWDLGDFMFCLIKKERIFRVFVCAG